MIIVDKKEIIGYYKHYEGEDMGIPIVVGSLCKTKDFDNDEKYIGTIEELLKEFSNKKIKITVEVLED